MECMAPPSFPCEKMSDQAEAREKEEACLSADLLRKEKKGSEGVGFQ